MNNEIEFTPKVVSIERNLFAFEWKLKPINRRTNVQETEWISKLKQFGIIEKEDEKVQEQLDKREEEKVDRSKVFDKKLAENEDDIDALFDELNDEDEQAFEVYRQKRLANLKAEYDRKRFGAVAEITKQNYVDEVNNAGEDIWVVVHVYKPGSVDVFVILLYSSQLINSPNIQNDFVQPDQPVSRQLGHALQHHQVREEHRRFVYTKLSRTKSARPVRLPQRLGGQETARRISNWQYQHEMWR